MREERKPTAVDQFCGCGGISAGLREAGFQIVAGADIEPNYICTFRHNFPESCVVTESLSALNPAHFIARIGIEAGELDLIALGQP